MQKEPIFTDTEVEALVRAAMRGTRKHLGRELQEYEAKDFIKWATEMRVAAILIDGAIEGRFEAHKPLAAEWTWSRPDVPATSRRFTGAVPV